MTALSRILQAAPGSASTLTPNQLQNATDLWKLGMPMPTDAQIGGAVIVMLAFVTLYIVYIYVKTMAKVRRQTR